MQILYRVFLFTMIFCTTAVLAIAQNLKDIKAEQISEVQLRQIAEKAEANQYSDEQLKLLATAQGMAPEEAAILVRKVKEYRNTAPDPSASRDGRQYNDPAADTIGGREGGNRYQQEDNPLDILKPRIFGADLFRSGNITFQPAMNMPTPANYVIGPGDELLVDLTGDNVASYSLKVSPEGFINIEYIGRVAVGGLSIEEGQAKIKSAMLGTYPALRSGGSKVSVNLGNIRSIKVTILGEVTHPGSYTLSSLSTVFNALYASGGPNENGSFRAIEVIRGNELITTIDVYDFLLNGIQTNNIRLQDQDVIKVPVYATRVEIAGEIKRPGIYEVLPGESLYDVVNFAGKFTTRAYKASIKAFQYTDRERRVIDIAADNFSDYRPKNGDKYIAEAVLDRFENRVEIKGAVFRPGVFALEPGLTLGKLIEKAAGLKEDAFLSRGYIIRLKQDNTQELISFSVEDILKGTVPDITLHREDIIQISSIFDLQDEYKVSVDGEVRAPGTFKYADNMTLGSLIQMAGGFREGASPDRIEVARRIRDFDPRSAKAKTAEIFSININQDLSISDKDFAIEPFDIITIRNMAGYEVQMRVRVEGEVLYPGTYTIQNKDERVSDLIKRAGGLTAFAYSEGASLNRPDTALTNGKNALKDTEKRQQEKLYNFHRLSQDSTESFEEVRQKQQMLSSSLIGINLEQILDNPHEKNDIILQNGDIIQVPKLLQTVKINGEVLRPNSVVYSGNRSFRSYINGAGGFTQEALKRGAFIQYANGSVAATRKFLFFNNYPAVKPGSEIFVPNRGPKEKVGTQGWIAIGTAIVSMSAMVFSLLKN